MGDVARTTDPGEQFDRDHGAELEALTAQHPLEPEFLEIGRAVGADFASLIPEMIAFGEVEWLEKLRACNHLESLDQAVAAARRVVARRGT